MINFKFNKVIPVHIGKIQLEGELSIPSGATSLVIFSHGSGSSRLSARNNYVAQELQKLNIGTFLFDLLTSHEDETYANRFNIELLTERLIMTTNYIAALPQCEGLSIGLFGASTGAASALRAAVGLPDVVRAVVSRGGRPDLAMDVVTKVTAPTLLIVGELDVDVLDLNRDVYKALKCEKKLEVIPGATHLFEEPGKLAEAAVSAAAWFDTHLQTMKKKTITIK